MLLFRASYAQVVLTNNATISETNATYDGSDLVISGATVAVDGAHFLNSLLLTNGAVLAHSPCNAAKTHLLNLFVTNAITVSTNSRIDVSGLGYLTGYTTGNTTNGAAAQYSGGSYGGLGGQYGGPPNAVYGDYTDPEDWGSGGSPFYGSGYAGGGLVRIKAGELVLEGQVLADGAKTGSSGSAAYAGGSGGGIRVEVGKLAGGGTIRAAGGMGSGGAGGGGRVAVYAQDFSAFTLTNVGAPGGPSSPTANPGGAGTVYLGNTNGIGGLLVIDGRAGGSGLTPLGMSASNTFVITDPVIIRGSAAHAVNEHTGLALLFQTGLTISDSAQLQINGDFQLPPTCALLLTNGGRLVVSGSFTSAAPVVLTNGGQLTVGGSFTPTAPVVVNSGGRLHIDGDFKPQGAFNLGTNGVVEVAGLLTSPVPLFVDGATCAADQVLAPGVVLTNGAILTCLASTTIRMHSLKLDVAGTLSVSANSRIDVSGLGYLTGYTTGNTTNGAAAQYSGGSYGGLGGQYGGPPNAVYGDYTDPEDWGSGGSPFYASGYAGGGLVRIKAGELVLEGQVLADGAKTGSSGSATYAGGSGGGIRVEVGKLAGGGTIRAAGGMGSGGAGGGGRVAVYAQDLSAFTLTNVGAPGGPWSPTANPGGAGTVYIGNTNGTGGLLVIDGRAGGSGLTPLGMSASNTFVITDPVIIRGSAAHAVNEHTGLALLFQTGLTISDSAQLQINGDFQLPPTCALLLTNGGRLIVSGSFTAAAPVVVNSGGRLHVDGDFNPQGAFSLGTNGVVEVAGLLKSPGPLTVDGATCAADQVLAPGVVLTNGAILTSLASTTTRMHGLELDVAGTLSVSANSRIDVSGKGYLTGYTTGNTTNGAATDYSGGSYGGVGGTYGPQPNAVYGDFADPEDWGSGGAVAYQSGSAGGGLARIRAGAVALDGEILADGATTVTSVGSPRAGGSGGGIKLEAGQLVGGGTIRAAGGTATGGVGVGGGGGGRIAVYALDYAGFTLTNVTAPGGQSPPAPGYGSNPGMAGTVHIVQGLLHTHVRTFAPVGRNGGYCSNLLESVTLVFNKPLDTNTLDTSALALAGPLGSFIATNAFQTGDRAYEFDFPAQSENGTYAFALAPSVLDAEGFPLDQNANGIPGESADGYSFALILDTIAPRITQQSPAGDIAGTANSVDLWFSEAMDASTLAPQQMTIVTPSNQNLKATNVTNVGLNRFRFAYPPQTAFGPYRLQLGRGATDLAGNPFNQSGTSLYGGSFNLVDVNLVLTNVVPSTNQFWAGDLVTVSWNERNRSGAPLIGSWTDAVYISADSTWDVSDTLVATVPHTGGLTNNELYSASATFNVPGLLPGDYYIIVRADIAGQERQSGRTNNSVTFGPIPVAVHELAAGGPSVSGALSANSPAHYFAITVAAGESLRLQLNGNHGVNQLFVNLATIPTRLNSDFNATTGNPSQSLVLTGVPGGGTYYVLVYGAQISGSTTYSLSADTAPFYVTAISPQTAVGGESPRFWVPLLQVLMPSATLTGVGFDAQTRVEFLDSKGVVRAPSNIDFVSPTTLHLYLPVVGWPADVYSVRVTKGLTTRTLSNAFTVVGAGEAKLEAHLVGPSGLDWLGKGPIGLNTENETPVATYYVEYENVGSRAMPAPLLKVVGYTNMIVETHRLNHIPNQTLGGISGGSGGGGRGALSIPQFFFQVGVPLYSAQVMALGSGSTPGILKPGDKGRAPVYFGGLLSWAIDLPSILFSVASVTADDTTIVQCPSPAPGVSGNVYFPQSGRRDPASLFGWITNGTICPQDPWTIDWNTLEATSKPETVDTDAWRAVWQNVVSNTGPLWADYILMLDGNMNYLAKLGQTTNDPGALFNFEVLKASGALNPVRILAGSVDASAPATGFPLVFRRVYRQPILSRYHLGPLGRGWTHNWDVSAQGLEQFNGVVVHGPNGIDRLFGRFADGTFTGIGGDAGKLTLTTNLIRLTEADGTVWQFGKANLNSPLDYVEDPNGNRITCGYTGGLLTSLTHSSGRQLLLEYNGAGRLIRLTDPLGTGSADDRVTTYEYDASGEHLARVNSPGGRVTAYDYHTSGPPPSLHALTLVVHPDLTSDSFSYDQQGRLAESSKTCCSGIQRVTFSYDSGGAVKVTDATGRSTQLLYGLGGQLAQVLDGEGRIINFSYDVFSELTQLLGPSGERYRYAYDELGNLAAVEDPLRQVNTFAYETTHNRLAGVTDARANGLQYTYDVRGNLTAITYADGTRERFAYDARGNVLSSTNRRGGVITYTHNSAGQITSKDYAATPGVTDFTYAYDAAGNLTNATYWDPQLQVQESIQLEYEPFTDFLTRIEYPGGKFFTFEHDAVGRRTRRLDQDGNVTAYLYDALGRLEGMTNGLGQLIVQYQYDPAGRLSRKTLGNGVFTTYAYNNAGQVTLLVNSRADSSVLSSFAYTYDASGRRNSMTTLAGTETYGYDPLGQLTSVTYPNGRVVTYAYDAAGNRTHVTDNGVSTPYSTNPLNQYTTVGDESLHYDADGNLTNKTDAVVNTTYAYNDENRLIEVATPTDNWAYTYDAFGNRIAATHNGETTRYLIDPIGFGNVASEYDGNGSLIACYDHGFGLLTRTDAAGDPAYYTFSAIGHTSELTDSSGAVSNAYSYDLFGLSLAKTEAIPNPFEFVGECGVMEEGNGLQSMRARSYAPNQGRFLQMDPMGIFNGLNQYAYCGNSPLSFVDSTGLNRDDDIWNGTKGPNQPAWNQLGPEGQHNARDWYNYLDELQQYRDRQQREYEAWQGGFKVVDELFEKVFEELLVKVAELFVPGVAEVNLMYLSGELMFRGGLIVSQPDNILNSFLTVFAIFRDPNDMMSPGGFGPAAFVKPTISLPYEILFENETNANAPAQQIIITNVLDANLDLSSLELTEITFANQVIQIPAGLNHYETTLPFKAGTNDIIAKVEAALDFPTRALTLTLTPIDPATGWLPADPFVGLLYPEDGSGRGKGSLSYLIKPAANLPSGSEIHNRAQIVFVPNDPIATRDVFNTVDGGSPTSQVLALPAVTTNKFLVQWSGQDDAGGSGVASYDLYVSIDGTNYARWLDHTAATSSTFDGIPGLTYYFYSIARDNVENEEAPPSQAQATTQILSPFTFGLTVGLQPSSPTVGASVADSVVVANTGPGDARGVVLTQTLPDALTIVSASPTQGGSSWTNNLITWQVGALTSNSQASLQLLLKPTVAGTYTILTGATCDQDVQANAQNILTVQAASPALGFALSAGSLELRWPTNGAAQFLVQSTESLTPPVHWEPVTNSPILVDGVQTLTLQPSNAAMFYRLRGAP